MTKVKEFLKKITKFDRLLDRQTPILLLVVLVLLLRIPNFFEPYWYGDEGIYLTIGQSMNKGAKLYSEIIDHKTPLIYYLARVQTQHNFRLLNLTWMMATTVAFYYISKKLFKSIKMTTLASFIFVILTTLPWLEGHIPNGELFVLGFVLWGMLILTKTKYFMNFFTPRAKKLPKFQTLSLYLCGFLVGLGIMTKVPAILDLAVILSIGWFTFTNSLSIKEIKKSSEVLLTKIYEMFIIGLGLLTPIIGSIIYFVAIGSGKDYLDFGLLYNFRYAGSWQLNLGSPILEAAFTLPGKFLIMMSFIILVTVFKKTFKPVSQFVISWFVLALFATLLSNRPYPHYLVQLVPALALLITLIISNLTEFTKDISISKNKLKPLFLLATQLSLIGLLIAVIMLLKVGFYQTTSYYKNWYELVTNKITKEEYRQTFDYLMTDNYKAAEIIAKSGTQDLFIWGTNPMLYALTETQPTGRFTVSFHIKDFDAFGETARDVVKKSPPFIVVMNNEDHLFPEFRNFLLQNYIHEGNDMFEHFTLWKKRPSSY